MPAFSLKVPTDYPDWLTSHYADGRFYEQGMLDHIRSVCRPGVFVDVGANAGNHSAYFALFCPSTRVHSFEPNQAMHGHFKAMMEINKVDHKVQLHQYALADQDGALEVTFVIRSHAPDWTAVVPARRMDDVLQTEDVAIIKVDVEGGEPHVLGGALGIIARCRPLIYAEAQNDEAQAATAAVLHRVGYCSTGRVFNHTPTYEYAPG